MAIKNVEKYLELKGWEYQKGPSGQYIVRTCPLCFNDKNKFYINETGLWDCKVCFTENSLVWTENGYKKIKDIKTEEKVLTKDGYFKKVIKTNRIKFNGNIKKFEIERANILNFSSTPDHILFGSKHERYAPDKWNILGKRKPPQKIEEIKSKFFNKYDYLYHPQRKIFRDVNYQEIIYNHKKDGPKVKDFIPLKMQNEPFFWWIIGWYIAEGCSITRGINFAFNNSKLKERETAEKVKSFFKKYGYTSNFTKSTRGTTGSLQVYDSYLEKWFAYFCGKGAINKQIPNFYLNTIAEKNIINGYIFGDGYIRSKTTSIKTVSKKLAQQLFAILSFNGYCPSIGIQKEKIDKNNIHHCECYSIYFSDSSKKSIYKGRNRTIVNIKSEKFSGYVYDLTIEDNHSYTISSIAVHNCGDSGNLYQLKAKLDDLDDEIIGIDKLIQQKYEPLDSEVLEQYIQNLKNNKEAYDYLTDKRGFSDETIKFFKLGCESDWITIPHFSKGKLWNIKTRNYKNKDFRRVQGQPSVLFNINNIDIFKPTITIVESETDAMAAWQMGIKNVVGLTSGAQTFLPQWVKWIQQFNTVFVCLNSDTAGQQGARKIAEKIGLDKCKNLILPTNDVNDYLLEKDSSKFINEFADAKKFNIRNISDISTYINNIDEWFVEDGALSGLSLPLTELNEKLKGFKAEDLIVIAGQSGIGKTTFSLNLLNKFCKDGHRCLAFFLEGKIMYYLLRMMSIEREMTIDELPEDKDAWENIKKQFLSYSLFFYSGAQADLGTEELKDLLKAAVKLHDIEFVVIDNLQKFVRDEYQVVQQTSRAVSILKDLAVDLDIPILLVSHIRKIPVDRKRITMYDAKSSSTIYQDADVYLTLWNNKNIDEKDAPDDLILTINKNRMGDSEYDISVNFKKELAIFVEKDSDEIDIKSLLPKKK